MFWIVKTYTKHICIILKFIIHIHKHIDEIFRNMIKVKSLFNYTFNYTFFMVKSVYTLEWFH